MVVVRNFCNDFVIAKNWHMKNDVKLFFNKL